MQSARVWTSVWRNAITKTIRRNYGGSNIKPPTLNDMPVPQGDFMQLHAKRQQGHHAVLALGVGMVSFGLFMYKSTNIVNFHGTPPATYE